MTRCMVATLRQDLGEDGGGRLDLLLMCGRQVLLESHLPLKRALHERLLVLLQLWVRRHGQRRQSIRHVPNETKHVLLFG